MSAYTYLTHTTAHGDRWDLISWQYYGDVLHIPILMAANPSASLDPILGQGIDLKIPIIDEPEADSSPAFPPWRS